MVMLFVFLFNRSLEFPATENGKDFLINVAVGTAIGNYVDVGLKPLKDIPILGKTADKVASFTISSGVNSVTETTENIISNQAKIQINEEK